MINKALLVVLILLSFGLNSNSQENTILREKTLVVWTAPLNLEQKGGSALTIDDGLSQFDGVIFGEIADQKWMAGSNNFERSLRDQTEVAAETSNSKDFVRIAIVYKENNITVYRNNLVYSSYEIDKLLEVDLAKASVLFGQRHVDVGDLTNTYVGRIRDARIYNSALDQNVILSLVPGEKGLGPDPWAWWDFNKGGLQDLMRRFSTIKIIGESYIEDACLVLKGNGSSLIVSNDGKSNSVSLDSSVPKSVIESTRLFREKLLADPYRPAYHFCVPEDKGYPGDPNGAFFYEGRYHLMYLYEREGSGFCWGHISSTDLLHWRHHPDALYPGEGDEGAFSGGAFVDDDGTAYLSYWMLWGDKGIGLTKNIDDNFDSWQKFSNNPVIKSTEWGITEMKDENGNDIHIGSADPSNIWLKNGTYYMLTGNLLVLNKYGRKPDSPVNEQGDRLYLFSSDDLITWKYMHRFYESKREWTEITEDNMCPSFLPLPSSPEGGAPSDKHLLLFISHNKGCQYYVGDYLNDHFTPLNHGRMTWIDQSYFAPEAMIDGQGRQLMWAWIFDERPAHMQAASGWTGTYGLPRSLWLGEDETLRISPIKEMENLRLKEQSRSNLIVKAGELIKLDDMSHELMEIELTIDPGQASKFGIKVGQSDDGREETIIFYDQDDEKLKVDTRKSGLDFGLKIIEEAPLSIAGDKTLTLRIFIDRSIVEVFANDRQAMARTVYPTLGGTGISLFSEGGEVTVLSIKTWELMPSNAY